MNKQAGFTIVEVMVVVAVLVIFATFVFVSLVNSGASARDGQRQADLRNLQAAVELYKVENGRYPESCNPNSGMNENDTNDWRGVWSGEPGTDYACQGDAPDYIKGLAPEFIPVLPRDPNLNGTDSGYVYATNPDGTAYKIMAFNTVESELVDYSHPLVRCGDMQLGEDENMCKSTPNRPTGGGGDAALPWCDIGTPTDINDTYAVSGGYALRGYWAPQMRQGTERTREFFTEVIRCK